MLNIIDNIFLTSFITKGNCSIILLNKSKVHNVILRLTKPNELLIISLRVPSILEKLPLNELIFIKQSQIKCSDHTSICFRSKINLIK